MVAILDADKEGYLRSTTSLVQTAGRAARHLNGKVYLYADVMTRSIKAFLAISQYRREKQCEHNKKHGITARSVSRAVEGGLVYRMQGKKQANQILNETAENLDVTETINELEVEMQEASVNLEFEKAALLRDQVRELKRSVGIEVPATSPTTPTKVSYRTKKKKSRRTVQLKRSTKRNTT